MAFRLPVPLAYTLLLSPVPLRRDGAFPFPENQSPFDYAIETPLDS
jgi:hypothetical protein